MGRYSVCFIDDNTPYHFDGTSFRGVKLPQKQSYCAGFIPAKFISSYAFQLPLDTDEESFAIKVERSFYKEGGLEANENYAIAYKRSKTKSETWYIEAFAAKEQKLVDVFGKTASKNKGAIDLISVPYCVYESLYTDGLLPKDSADIIIHYGIDITFAALHKDGSFLSFRQLPSLRILAKRWKIDVDFLVNALSQWGLKKELYPEDQLPLYAALETHMHDVFTKILDMIRHKGGLFGILTPDRIYLDFMRMEIPGFWSMLDEIGFLSAKKSPLICCSDADEKEQFRYIEALYAGQASLGLIDAPNLSVFERTPPFYRTHTGKLFLSTAAAFILVALPSFLLQQQETALKKEKATLQAELSKKEELQKQKRKLLSKLGDEKDAVQKKVDTQQKITNGWVEVGKLVLDSKQNVRNRRKMLKDINHALSHYKLKAISFKAYEDKNVSIVIYSTQQEREKIAEFMNEIKKSGYSSVDTQLISRDGNLYKSLVEVVR